MTWFRGQIIINCSLKSTHEYKLAIKLVFSSVKWCVKPFGRSQRASGWNFKWYTAKFLWNGSRNCSFFFCYQLCSHYHYEAVMINIIKYIKSDDMLHVFLNIISRAWAHGSYHASPRNNEHEFVMFRTWHFWWGVTRLVQCFSNLS